MTDRHSYNVRPATEADLPALVGLKSSLALHKDRLRDAEAGSYLIARMEETARARGSTHFYLGVDPVDNPQAHQRYLRLGYSPLQTQPYRLHWKLVDSDGDLHEGIDWRIDLVKELDFDNQ